MSFQISDNNIFTYIHWTLSFFFVTTTKFSCIWKTLWQPVVGKHWWAFFFPANCYPLSYPLPLSFSVWSFSSAKKKKCKKKINKHFFFCKNKLIFDTLLRKIKVFIWTNKKKEQEQKQKHFLFFFWHKILWLFLPILFFFSIFSFFFSFIFCW